MYFYISFLRAPPLYARPILTQPLPIKVQITNDLRTEFLDQDVEIFYSWVQFAGATNQTSSIPFTKLTTWRQSNTYTELKVYPPTDVKEGQKWQLVLCSPRAGRGQGVLSAIDLSKNEQSTNIGPFPVLSLPILFTSKQRSGLGDTKGGKQEQIERLIKLPVASSSTAETAIQRPKQSILKIVEHLAFDLDKKMWDSGIGLSNWLTYLIAPDVVGSTAPRELTAILSKPSVNILELGSGTGIVSIALAALLSRQTTQLSSNVRITATDLPSAMPVLEHNITLNKHHFANSVSVEAAVLDWEDEDLPPCAQGSVDLILMADVTYNTASFPALINTLKRLSTTPRGSSNQPTESDNAQSAKSVAGTNVETPRGDHLPLVLLAYKERDPAERILWVMSREIGLVFKDIDQLPGAGGAPVEIYLGTFVRQSG